MVNRKKPKRPRNDNLIIRLLEEGRIRVEEDENDLVLDKLTGVMRPKTVIYTRDMRSKQKVVWRKRTVLPILEGHGYFSLWPEGWRGPQVFLSARRVVWYAFLKERKLTSHMICPWDGDPMNYNRWNLVERDQNEQNFETKYRKAFPEMYGDCEPPIQEVPF